MHEDQQTQVLVVQDKTSESQSLIDNLRGEFSVAFATSSREARNLINENVLRPKVVLLDAELSGMDGYHTCEELRSQGLDKGTEILFLSRNESIQERLRGYEVGASDILCLPKEQSEITHKVRLAVERAETREEIQTQADTAMQTAMNAIMDAGEQGTVTHFMRLCLKAETPSELASLIVASLQDFDLSCSVQIRLEGGDIHASTLEPIPPLEIELLMKLRNARRIHQHGRRLILNYGNISVLVKNLPDDPEKAGRFRDQLALVMEGAQSQLSSISMQYDIKKLIADSSQALQRIQKLQSSQKKQSLGVLEQMTRELTVMFFDYGLTEVQEQTLMKIIEDYSEQMLLTYESGFQIDEELSHITDQLRISLEQTNPATPEEQSDNSFLL